MGGRSAGSTEGAKRFRYARSRIRWASVRDSLWFLPGVLTLTGAGLAVFGIWLEQHWLKGRLSGVWVFGGGAEGARGVLSAIAGGLITVTGVVFSVTIVALQLASTQFTPRVLRNFTSDRANQLVLGVFIGTFTYTLLVLRSVTASNGGKDAFVPALAVGVSVALVLVSIGFLIFFIHHAARSIQASFIVNRVTAQTLRTLHTLLPEPQDAPAVTPPPTEGEGGAIAGRIGGYIQNVDEPALLRLIEENGLVIRLERRVGDHVLVDEPLARVWPAAKGDEVGEEVRRAVVVGFERTPEQDVEFGIIELADIAVKALSPGINDPTTAMLCIDRLGEIAADWGRRLDRREIVRAAGRGALVWPVSSYERALGLSFDQVIHYGAANPTILRRLDDVLARVRRLVREENRAALDAQRAALRAATGGGSGQERRG